jgi:uncharacterized repeat protein (TIGR01451 family)
LTVGSHTITAVYSGDGNFQPSTGNVVQTVNKAHSTTTVTSSVNPSVVGQPVTFTATVSTVAPGAGTPSGTVQFLDNGTPVGAPVALSGGVATMNTSALTVGSHTITAVYSGDGNFQPSTGSVVQAVNKANSTTTVTSSVNPSVFGQSVTFTATVSAVAPGIGTPSGLVQFRDNGTPIGAPVALSGGVATMNTSALTVGSHTITADYLGAGNFNVSAGAVTQTVSPAANPVLRLTKSVDKATAGPGDTLVYTLTYANTGSGPATGVTIRDVVPNNTAFVSASGGGTHSAGTVSWTIGNLAAGASGSVTLTVRISEALSCPGGANSCAIGVTNKGTITSTQTPSLTSSNTVTTQVTVPPPVAFPAGGAFVIGDRAAHATGARVNFWGAQWWKNNPVSAGTSPGHQSFKGFTNAPAMPTCGDTWSTRPGNSSNPPNGPLPDAMAIIVTGNVMKNGAVLSGVVKQIIVVRPEPGYDSNPGHAGYGQVLFEVCSM